MYLPLSQEGLDGEAGAPTEGSVGCTLLPELYTIHQRPGKLQPQLRIDTHGNAHTLYTRAVNPCSQWRGAPMAITFVQFVLPYITAESPQVCALEPAPLPAAEASEE